MKYIYYIIAILLVLSAVIGYLLTPPRVQEKKAAIVINGKVITADEFDRLYASRPGGLSGREAFVNSLITRELLIQESRREGIDKEEPFVQSIRNFYEQSLVKLLMDRKFASLHPDVTDEEVDRYLAFLGKKLHLTIFSFSDIRKAEKGASKNGEKRTLFLSDLSPELKAAVAALRVGGSTGPIQCGESYLIVRLDGTENDSSAPSSADREEARKALIGEKKEAMINEWIADLRKKAAVQIWVKE